VPTGSDQDDFRFTAFLFQTGRELDHLVEHHLLGERPRDGGPADVEMALDQDT
jgi:hypothetical protein